MKLNHIRGDGAELRFEMEFEESDPRTFIPGDTLTAIVHLSIGKLNIKLDPYKTCPCCRQEWRRGHEA